MDENKLREKIAQLEFCNDQLVSELAYVDQLMREVGFSDGLETVKLTARDMYDEGLDGSESDRDV